MSGKPQMVKVIAGKDAGFLHEELDGCVSIAFARGKDARGVEIALPMQMIVAVPHVEQYDKQDIRELMAVVTGYLWSDGMKGDQTECMADRMSMCLSAGATLRSMLEGDE